MLRCISVCAKPSVHLTGWKTCTVKLKWLKIDLLLPQISQTWRRWPTNNSFSAEVDGVPFQQKARNATRDTSPRIIYGRLLLKDLIGFHFPLPGFSCRSWRPAWRSCTSCWWNGLFLSQFLRDWLHKVFMKQRRWGTLEAVGECVIRLLFRLFLAFSWFYRDLLGSAEVSQHSHKSPGPVKNLACMASNEHLETRLLKQAVTLGGERIICH